MESYRDSVPLPQVLIDQATLQKTNGLSSSFDGYLLRE